MVKLKGKDILEPPITEYEEGDKKSPVGWLKEIFLFNCQDSVNITAEDRRRYSKACNKFKELADIPKGTDLDEWEINYKLSPATVARIINKIGKEL